MPRVQSRRSFLLGLASIIAYPRHAQQEYSLPTQTHPSLLHQT